MANALKVEYIKPLIKTTRDIFSSMFSLDINSGQPFVFEENITHRWEITGGIVLKGNVKGFFAIRMSVVLVNKLLEKSGIEYDELDKLELASELLKEIVNIISSHVSTELSVYGIEVSIPFILKGKNHLLKVPKELPVISIPFTSIFGPFEICIGLIE